MKRYLIDFCAQLIYSKLLLSLFFTCISSRKEKKLAFKQYFRVLPETGLTLARHFHILLENNSLTTFPYPSRKQLTSNSVSMSLQKPNPLVNSYFHVPLFHLCPSSMVPSNQKHQPPFPTATKTAKTAAYPAVATIKLASSAALVTANTSPNKTIATLLVTSDFVNVGRSDMMTIGTMMLTPP